MGTIVSAVLKAQTKGFVRERGPASEQEFVFNIIPVLNSHFFAQTSFESLNLFKICSDFFPRYFEKYISSELSWCLAFSINDFVGIGNLFV